MASSPPNARRDAAGDTDAPEPFPSMPVPVTTTAINNAGSTVTTTTTTTTMFPSRGRPYTVTSSYPPGQDPGQPSTQVPVPVAGRTPNETSATPLTRTVVSTTPQVNRIRPIGIRRIPSTNLRLVTDGSGPADNAAGVNRSSSGRGRSTSAPQTPSGTNTLTRQATRQSLLPTLHENNATTGANPDPAPEPGTGTVSRRRSVSNAARSVLSRFSDNSRERQQPEYESEVVDLLDVLDPEVATLTTLTNVQNSLFVPDLGRWLNRRPTYELSRRPTSSRPATVPEHEVQDTTMSPIVSEPTPVDPKPEDDTFGETPAIQRTWSWQRQPRIERSHSISSVLTESHYAVLPHGVSLEGWSDEDKEALDDHVRHMLHSKRSKFKQRMVAFGKYVRKPLGFFVTLYAVLITLFGLAWVLFLIGWVYVGDQQLYIINIIDNVLVALFAIVGDGLAPFRVVDTYHMSYIAHYHHLTWRLRRERALPELQDHNDLPAQTEKEVDPEAAKTSENGADNEFSVLTPKQQQKLIHHQAKFSKSHSFYKPHETVTHHAFPLRLLVAIVVLLDCHSMFQIALGACTWGISYHVRPPALTATILACSITVNITAGILISVGDRRTRKKDVVLRMTRQELTSTAMKKVEKHKRERAEHLRQSQATETFEVIDEETSDPVKHRS